MTHPQTQSSSAEESASGGDASEAAASQRPAARRSGLGRGLAALIPRSAPVADTVTLPQAPAAVPEPSPVVDGRAPEQRENLRNIPLRAITLNPNQPRKEFRREELDDLTSSVREHGILQPIAVRSRIGADAKPSYELIAGERRFRAASAAGLTEIPALVKEDVSDRDSLALAIIENVQREDLNVIEAAQGYDELLHAYNMTQTELAQSIGKSQPQIANTLRMLNLPAPIQDSLRSWSISEGHAKVILSLKTEPEQTALWTDILQNGLTVRQAEKRAVSIKSSAGVSAKAAPAPARASSAAPDSHLTEIIQRISLSLGTKVRLFPGRGQSGVIEISYFDQDQLEDLLEKLHA